jgi:hypothetical protein
MDWSGWKPIDEVEYIGLVEWDGMAQNPWIGLARQWQSKNGQKWFKKVKLRWKKHEPGRIEMKMAWTWWNWMVTLCNWDKLADNALKLGCTSWKPAARGWTTLTTNRVENGLNWQLAGSSWLIKPRASASNYVLKEV